MPSVEEISLHVNVSPRELSERSFFRDVGAVIADSGLDPGQLTVEVTETVVSEPGHERVLNQLRAQGVTIALDDFGTGYSSLAMIDSLPIDVVKLDHSFTRSVVASQRNESLVGATIVLAHTLDLVVVAEGVEDDDQMQLLVELGCDCIQGYLVGRPAPLRSLAI